MKVLYLAGAAHCGSTILDILLGEADRILGGGQLADLYKHGRCSCGQPLQDCEQWGEVLAHPSFPGREALKRTGRWTRRERGLPRMVASERRRTDYAEVHDGLLGAIFETTGVDVLVDSSKNMARALALAESSRFEVRVVHLIRDPRGFVASTNRRNRENDRPRQFVRPLAEWTIKNAIGSQLLRRWVGDRYLGIAYEDLLTEPEATLSRIGIHTGVSLDEITTMIEQERPFHPRHLFAGNRVSRRDQVVFDPDRIRSNRMDEPTNTLFWYGGAWIARAWGYRRRQFYLPDRSTT